jgi:hypothetical protein
MEPGSNPAPPPVLIAGTKGKNDSGSVATLRPERSGQRAGALERGGEILGER